MLLTDKLMYKIFGHLAFITDCGPLVSPENGAVDTSSGSTLGREAVYSCKPGYDLTGSSIVVCLSTSHWSDNPPVCVVKGRDLALKALSKIVKDDIL